MTGEAIDDEMPAPPPAQGATQEAVDDTIDAAAFDGVADLGEVIPAGTWHFRLERHWEKWAEPTKDELAVDKDAVAQPYFGVVWICQQEPHTGKEFLENVPWVNQITLKRAAAGDPIAKAIISERLKKAKAIMKAAGFIPTGAFKFKESFLSTHPEVKIPVTVSERKIAGKATGEMRNFCNKYLPLMRPA